MPHQRISNSILLPELNLKNVERLNRWEKKLHCEKYSEMEVCPKCATPSKTIYDHREVKIKDAPIRHYRVILKIKKRRFLCKTCKKPFTEPVQGILPRRKTTQRFRTHVYWACENFSSLTRVKRAVRCSNHFIYSALYEKLELNRRMKQNPWPHTIGIDEHSFLRKNRYKKHSFVTMIVDYKNNRLKEVVNGKTGTDLCESLKNIEGRENVKKAVIDMCDPYRSFIKDFFPNAEIIADKFHVLRLLNPTLNKMRTSITGDKRKHPARWLLLTNQKRLEPWERGALLKWLEQYPELMEVYQYKEALSRFYRIRGYHKASRILIKLTDQMALSKLKEIQTLRKTLLRWKQEVLNYFKFRVTNAKTEGYNNVAKVIKRMAYGFRSFKNYRLRLLNACC